MSQVRSTDDAPGAAAEFIARNLGRWQALLQELIRIPSHFGSEHAIVDRVARHIRELGVRVERVPHDPQRLRLLPDAQPPLCDTPGRCSLVARIPGAGQGRSLAINTHLDVVPEGDTAQWQYPPYAGHIDAERGIIYGRGAMDDKAGVVVALALLETLARGIVRPAGDVVFHFVLEDETTGNGTLLCLDAGHGADAALILDGTRKEKAVNEHAGNMEFEVRLSGRPASVVVSHVGVNAAELMARLLIRLREAFFALNETRGSMAAISEPVPACHSQNQERRPPQDRARDRLGPVLPHLSAAAHARHHSHAFAECRPAVCRRTPPAHAAGAGLGGLRQ